MMLKHLLILFRIFGMLMILWSLLVVLIWSVLLIMCVSPVLIPNPNYHNKSELIRNTVDTESQFIKVPCNHCPECISARQNQLVDRCRCLALDHYIFFCTLTYNNQSLPRLVTSTGYSIPFADIADVQRMMKRIRIADSFGRKFLYFFCSERGKENSRPHFHGLIFIPKFKDDDKLFPAQLETSVRNVIFSEWRRNYGSKRVPIWKPLFTYRSKYVGSKRYSNFDCHYVTPHTTEHGSDDVAFYVSKYVLKSSPKENALQSALRLNLGEDEYKSVWDIVKSRCFFSKGFGASTDLEKAHVLRCIDLSKDHSDGLKFFHADGSSSPLPRYYRKFLSADSAIQSVKSRGGPITFDNRSLDEKLRSVDRGKKIVSIVSDRDISEFYTND